MSLLFVDGFDNYTTDTQSNQKWTQTGVNTAIVVPRRAGSRYGIMPNAGLGFGTGKQVAGANEHTTFIVGLAVYRVADTSPLYLIFGSDSFGTMHVSVTVNTNGSISVRKGLPNDTALLTSDPDVIGVNIWRYISAKVFLDDAVGTIDVEVDGVAVPTLAQYVGDTKNGGTKTVLDCFSIGGAGGGIYADDVFLMNGAGSRNNDLPGSDMIVDTLFPVGTGNTTGLTPTGNPDNWDNVHEVPPDDDTTYNAATTDGLYDTYQFSDTILGASAAIAGMVANNWARKDTADPKAVAPVVRSGGIDNLGVDTPISENYSFYRQVYELNPTTTSPFIVSEINAIEAGTNCEACLMAAEARSSQLSLEVVVDGEVGQLRISQATLEVLGVLTPPTADCRTSQSSLEVAGVEEVGNARISHISLEVVGGGVASQPAICPLFEGDKTYTIPPGTIASNAIYSWRARPVFDGNPGEFSGCCTFQPISIGARVSQTSIEVLAENVVE